MSGNFTKSNIIEKIIAELDIRVLLHKIFDEELYHKDAVKNTYLLEGKVENEYDFTETKRQSYICPFHVTDNDGSASLYIDNSEGHQSFRCFKGCCGSKYLNVISLYMVLVENVDPDLLYTEEAGAEFAKALKALADIIGIDYDHNKRKLSPEEQKAETKRRIREEAGLLYHNAWKDHKVRNIAHEYMLEKRGFKYGITPLEELVEKYKIGFAPSKFGWTWLYDRLKRKYTNSELLDAGVIFNYRKKDKETKEYIGEPKIIDFFNSGVVLPYFSNGKINNLYSRSILAKDDRFRHLRLQGGVDIPINFDVAKKFQELIIVEGEFSWLSLIALGYENTLGSRGTNGMHQTHIDMIKSIKHKTSGAKCNTIYLCFDSDEAGQEAIEKTGDKLVKSGFDVRVIRMADDDPNDLLQKYKEKARERFEELKSDAISYEAFMIIREVKKFNPKTNVQKLAVIKSARKYIEFAKKDELVFIGFELAELFDLNRYQLNWLLESWVGEREETNPGFYNAIDNHTWLLLTEDPMVFDALYDNQVINNVVFVKDVKNLVTEIKNSNKQPNIVLDEKFNPVKIQYMQKELSNSTFRMFSPPSIDDLKNAKKNDIVSMIKKMKSSNEKLG